MANNSVLGQPHGIRPPPPGVVADFQHRQNQTADIIAFHVVTLFFVTTAVVIRLYTRFFINRSVGVDDYLCIIAYILICVNVGLFAGMTAKGVLGFHIWEVTPSQSLAVQKMEIAAEAIYVHITATIKLSYLVFYRRIFKPNVRVRYLCYGGMVFIVTAYTTFFILSYCSCIPMAKRWDPSIPGHCLPSDVTVYGPGILNVVTDVFIVTLPLPVLWRLNATLSKKLKTIALFGLGFVVVGLSITRLALTPMVFRSYDSTWELARFSVYSNLEIDIGMICSCLLAFPSFLDHYSPVVRDKWRSYIGVIKFGRRNPKNETEKSSNGHDSDSNSDGDSSHGSGSTGNRDQTNRNDSTSLLRDDAATIRPEMSSRDHNNNNDGGKMLLAPGVYNVYNDGDAAAICALIRTNQPTGGKSTK